MHHGHSHGGGTDEKSDWVTNVGAFGELVEAGANLFVGMEFYNILYELIHKEENNALLGPLCVGSLLALVSIGSAFTHRWLDTLHQTVRVNNNCKHDEIVSVPSVEENSADSSLELDALSHQNSDSQRSLKQLKQPLNSDSDNTSSQRFSFRQALGVLSGWQRFAIFGDAVSHVGGRQGLFMGVVAGLVANFTKATLSIEAKATTALIAFVFAVTTSASGIRTCANGKAELILRKKM